MTTANQSSSFLDDFSDKLENMADIINVNKRLRMDRDTSILLIEYKLNCEKRASTFAEHEEMRKAELSHRYFKALKLAGAYAFIGPPAASSVPRLSLFRWIYQYE